MRSFCFIHAADLHLDVTLPTGCGVFNSSGRLEEGQGNQRYQGNQGQMERKITHLAQEAVFIAWRNLVQLCLEEKADFLLLAGDLYHQEDGSLKACFALRDGFERLKEAGIKVFVVRGNHDYLPAAQDKQEQMSWPDNVHVFGRKIERVLLEISPERRVLVHGVSHSGPAETKNLSQGFKRQEAKPLESLEKEAFQIGLLHCCIGKADGHKAYAPCSLGDLAATQLDYWALGHIHERKELSRQRPAVHYPGAAQGLHVKETGQHGCLLARADSNGQVETEFRPLAPVQWEILRLDLETLRQENAASVERSTPSASSQDINPELTPEFTPELILDELVNMLLEKMRESAEQNASPLCQTVIFRLVLQGRSSLDTLLRKPGAADGLAGELRERLCATLTQLRADSVLSGQLLLWLKDLRVQTRPERDLETLRQSDGFLGELLRYSDELSKGEAEFQNACPQYFSELYDSKRYKKYLPEPPTPETILRLTREAEEICLNKFGVD